MSPPHVCSFHLPGSSSHQYLTASPWRLYSIDYRWVDFAWFKPSGAPLSLAQAPEHDSGTFQDVVPASLSSFLSDCPAFWILCRSNIQQFLCSTPPVTALLAFLLQFLYPSPYFTWLTPVHPLRLNFLFLQHFTVRCSVYVIIDWLTVLLLKRNHKRCQAFTYRCLLDQN